VNLKFVLELGFVLFGKKMKKALSDIILFNFKGLLEYPEATLKYERVSLSTTMFLIQFQ